MTRAGLLALAMLALATGGSAADLAAPRSTDISAYEFKGLYSCVHDRILAGPDGEVAVWWGDDRQLLGSSIRVPGEVIVGRMHDRARAGEDRFFLYGGGGKVFYPVRWAGRGGLLFIRSRGPDSRILTIDAGGGPVHEIAKLDAAWRLVSIDAVGQGGVDALLSTGAAARAAQVDGEGLVRGHATLGTGLEMVGARRSDMELVNIGETSTRPVGINAGHTLSLTLFPDSRTYPAGVAYLGAPANGRAYLPYQLPLIDQATGRIAGRFGPGGIAIDGRSRLSGRLAEFRRIHGQSRIVLDASLSGQTLMALTVSGRGNRAIVRIAPDGISEKPICTDVVGTDVRRRTSPNPLVSADTAYRPLFRTFSLDARGRETSEPGRPILTVYRLGEGPLRDAILKFHGGPGVSNAEADFRPSSFLKPGRDVVSVEYSGSIGGGNALTRRLGERGIAALEEDVDAIVRWLDRQGYRRVFIDGSSFGSAPALAALDRHRRRFAAAFLFAPLLRLPEPKEHVDRGKFDSIAADTQLAYERALLGGAAGRERFRVELAQLVKRAPLTASDRIYFAEHDPVSSPADLPPGIAARHEVIPHSNHAFLMTSPTEVRAIEEEMR